MADTKAGKNPNQLLAEAVGDLRKSYGDSVLSTLQNQKYEYIPTGIPQLNAVLGHPGIIRKKMVEFYGPESTGKSLVCETICMAAQAEGLISLYVDYEHSLDKVFLTSIGLILGKNFFVIDAETMEDGFDKAFPLLDTGAIDLVVFDSVGAMTPKKRLERPAGDATPGDLARHLSICLSQLQPRMLRHNFAVIFTNHTRMSGFGSPSGAQETRPGGKALKFYLHQSVRLGRVRMLKVGPAIVGQEIEFSNQKNKVAQPHLRAKIKMMANMGIDKFGYAIEALEKKGIITVGSTGWIKSEQLGINIRGKDVFRDMLRQDAQLGDKVLSLIADFVEVGVTEEVIGESEND